jgi:hypothetical protein
MSRRRRLYTRASALAVTASAALAVGALATPVAHAGVTGSAPRAVTPVAGASPTPGVRVVTMITGDRVVLRTTADGRVAASMTPDSPDFGHPVKTFTVADHTYVIPTLSRSLQAKIDPSLFDVAALARQSNVSLDVTFKKGAAARSLPGLKAGSARTVAGRTTVRTSYDAHRPLPASFTRSLASVAKVSVRGASDLGVPSGYELHTLTINGTDPSGSPIRQGLVFVLNMDDGRLFGSVGLLVDGRWKVSVPSGHYAVIVPGRRRLLFDQTTVGSADTSLSVSMAAATVKPRSVYPGHKSIAPELDLIGKDAHGNTFDFGFGGSLPLLNPVSHVNVGSLVTEVSNQFAPLHYKPFVFSPKGGGKTNPLTFVANTKDVLPNVPRHINLVYRAKDFARIDIVHHATGPKTETGDLWGGFSPVDSIIFTSSWPTVRPGVVHAQFEGNPNTLWLSSTMVSNSFRSFGELDSFARYHRGQHAAIQFFRAPMTPVADRGMESGRTDLFCSLCVHGGVLHGGLSMMVSAGTDQSGFTSTGRWQLFGKRGQIASGRGEIAPHVSGVAANEPMTLVAQTGKQSLKWRLSTKVLDAWSFRVPAHDAVVPILRASYVPPTGLQSQGRKGTESFPITFDNLGPVDARVVRAAVRYSVDGRHWHAAHLTREDKNTFQVSYVNPAATRTHPALSLAIRATDAAGRRMLEEVHNAYWLPATSSVHGGTRATAPTTQTTGSDRFHPNRICRAPSAHRDTCYVELDAHTKALGRATPDPAGWGAPALRDAYDVPATSSTATVAVVIPFNYPDAEQDMNHYRAQFGLPACTSASGCFSKINQNGEHGHYPPQDFDAGVEASLDLQMISAACPTCHIVLAEANRFTDRSLGAATMAAIGAGATVTNHSYGGIEVTGTNALAAPYDQPGVTAVSSTGDEGYGPASFPASAPGVVAVGGTTLARSATTARGWTEKVWEYGGSGCSAYFAKPVWQTDTACHHRTDADIAAVAHGLAIYNTSLPRRYRGWLEVDGTSASSPFVAGLIGNANAGGIKPGALYGHPGDFNDVVSGSNGFCQGSYMCTAGPGYDGPTGWGTPKGIAPFVGP